MTYRISSKGERVDLTAEEQADFDARLAAHEAALPALRAAAEAAQAEIDRKAAGDAKFRDLTVLAEAIAALRREVAGAATREDTDALDKLEADLDEVKTR